MSRSSGAILAQEMTQRRSRRAPLRRNIISIAESGFCEPLITRRSYWATLQPGTLGYRNFAMQMTNPPLACGLVSKVSHTPESNVASR
jgi:hypothetical protein